MAKKTLRYVNQAESAIAALAYVCTAAILIADVLSREVTNQAILGAPQVAVLFAAVAAFLGFGIATAQGTHIRPTVLDWVSNGPKADVVSRVSDGTSALILFFFSWHAVLFVASTYRWGDRAEVLYIYLWPLQSVIPLVLLTAGTRHVIFAIWPDLKPAGTLSVIGPVGARGK